MKVLCEMSETCHMDAITIHGGIGFELAYPYKGNRYYVFFSNQMEYAKDFIKKLRDAGYQFPYEVIVNELN